MNAVVPIVGLVTGKLCRRINRAHFSGTRQGPLMIDALELLHIE